MKATASSRSVPLAGNPLALKLAVSAALDRPAAKLSGGEAQRLKLAGHMAKARGRRAEEQGSLFLFDEPTTGLDADTATRVLTNLRVALAGRAVLTASHQPVEIGIADRRVGIG